MSHWPENQGPSTADEGAVLADALRVVAAAIGAVGHSSAMQESGAVEPASAPRWSWDAQREALVTPVLVDELWLGLEPDALQVVAFDARGRVCSELSLLDLTVDEAVAQVVERLKELGVAASDSPAPALAPTHHGRKDGATFEPGNPAERTLIAPSFATK